MLSRLAKHSQRAMRFYSSNSNATKVAVPAFGFDIDGVLLKDGVPIGNSKRALRAVTGKDRGGLHPTGLPYIFLTNGGGVPEAQRAKQLSEVFDIHVEPSQVCLSHTPMAPLSSRYGDNLVCVVGMHDVKEVAEQYGFTNVITPAEIKAQFPLLAPHARYDPKHFPAHAPTSTSFRNAAAAIDEAHALLSRISAVLVMHDPRDWYVDLQVLVDILVTSREVNEQAINEPAKAAAAAGGAAGAALSAAATGSACGSKSSSSSTPAASSGSGGGCGKAGGCPCAGGKKPVPHLPIYFSNPDLLYSSTYRLPRLAQGAFAVCLNQLYLGITGSEIVPHTFGKPTPATYSHADKLIRAEADRIYSPDTPIGMTYGIGDNPHADILGANQAGEHWASVFVRTGSIPLSSDDRMKPRYIFENVDVAVHTLLSKYGM